MASTLLVFVIFAALFAALVAFAWWWQTHGGGLRERERAEEESRMRAVRVRQAGWRYDDTQAGDIKYRIHGTTPGGLDWVIEYNSEHGSSSPSPKLLFRAAALGNGEYVWQIFDRRVYDFVRKGVGRVLIGGAVKLISLMSKTMAEKSSFFYTAVELPAGTTAWRKRYALIATDKRFARLIDRDTERRILGWPEFKPSMSSRDNCFAAGLEPKEMHAHLYVDGPSFAVIEHMVQLGEALADHSKTLTLGTH